MKAVILFCNVFFFTAIIVNANNSLLPHEKQQQAKQWIQQQPVLFMENKGQMADIFGSPAPFVLFRADAPGMNVFITEKGITYLFLKAGEEDDETRRNKKESANAFKEHNETEDKSLSIAWTRVDMTLEGANIQKENIVKENPSVTDFNFFYAHCPEGIYGVKQFEKVTIRNIYPGIDWVLYGSSQSGMKYDFIVHSGADPSQILLHYESGAPINLRKDGSISAKTRLGNLTEQAPYSYVKETGQEIENRFKIISEKKTKSHFETILAFDLAPYTLEAGSSLIIDPDLTWGTFYGGSNTFEGALSVATDKTGNLYATGYMSSFGTISSTDFPTQADAGTYYDTTLTGYDAFIICFNNKGGLRWATFYGGSGYDQANSITTDISGNVYVTGITGSPDFPTQQGTGAFAGAFFNGTISSGGSDIFILRFNSSGAREWATYYSSGIAYSIATDLSGNVYVTGAVYSVSFPAQPGTGSFAGAYYDGTPNGVDVFILRFSNNGILEWATVYGGSSDERGYSIVTDVSGSIYLTGYTYSTDFPTQIGTGSFSGAYYDGTYNSSVYSYDNGDAFILRFNSSGVRQWATYYGGGSIDYGNSIITDGAGNVYVTGYTISPDFPTQSGIGALTNGYYDGALNGSEYDVFILRFSNTGVRQWVTYYGGSNNEKIRSDAIFNNLAVDDSNNVYVSFDTKSTDINTLDEGCGNYFDGALGSVGYSDQFLLKFNDSCILKLATYIGGYGEDFRAPIATGIGNNLYMMGEWTGINPDSSKSYPLFDPAGGTYFDDSFNGSDDCFVLKLSPCSNPISVSVDSKNVSCYGQCDGTATSTPSGGTMPYTFLWNNGKTTPTVTGLCAGTYSVTISDLNGGVFSSSLIQIEEGNAVNAGTISAQRDTICAGTPANLSVTGNSSTIQWKSSVTGNNFNEIAGATNSAFVDLPSETTFYKVVAEDRNCRDSSAAFQLVVKPSPVSTFTEIINNLEVNFNSSGTSGDVTVFDWDFGDSTNSDLPSPSHTFSRSDTFHVCLTVFNGSNCSFTICKDLLVGITGVTPPSSKSSFIVFPTPFTNSVFIDKQKNMQIKDIEIYDLTGRLLFKKNYAAGENPIQIRLSDLLPGMYYLKIKTGGETYNRKIIKE